MFGPLVGLLEQHGADQADHRVPVGEDADDVGAAPDLLVQPLLGVVGPDLAPGLAGEAGERQQVVLGVGQVGWSATPTAQRRFGDGLGGRGGHRICRAHPSRFELVDHPALWVTERGGRIKPAEINARFVAFRDALNLPKELSPHSLRHVYVTHLTDDGADRRFLQEQVGHRCDTSTAIYTHVSGDFMNTALRRAIGPALNPQTEP